MLELCSDNFQIGHMYFTRYRCLAGFSIIFRIAIRNCVYTDNPLSYQIKHCTEFGDWYNDMALIYNRNRKLQKI